MAKKTRIKQRDSNATRALLIQAVGELMADKGIAALGVNAVAKQAGVDKVLIYRYFDGLPGLIEAYAKEGDFWPKLEEYCGGDMEAFLQMPYADRSVTVAINFLRAIRKRPLTQEILAWEMLESNELTKELNDVRENRAMHLMPLLAEPNKADPHMLAIAAIIGAAVNYLCCRSRHLRFFNGIDLQSEQGWQQIEHAIEHLIRLNAETTN